MQQADSLEYCLKNLDFQLETLKSPGAIIGYIRSTQERFDTIATSIEKRYSPTYSLHLDLNDHYYTTPDLFEIIIPKGQEGSLTMIAIKGAEKIGRFHAARDQTIHEAFRKDIQGQLLLLYNITSKAIAQATDARMSIAGNTQKQFYWKF